MWSMLKFMFYALIVGLLIIFYAPREFVFDIWSKIKNFDFFENEEEVEEIESQGNLSAKKIKRLIIKTEQRDVGNTLGWGEDIKSTLSELNLPQDRKNVCSVIAVIAQESSFRANPSVANLSGQLEKRVKDVDDKIPDILGFKLKDFLKKYPSPEDNYYAKLHKARTEKDVDMIYRTIMTDHANPLVLKMLTPLIENMNKVDTVGSMQVAVAYAIDVEEKKGNSLDLDEIWELRDYMYSRKGGVFYGTHLLLTYPASYDKQIYRFADFNAGRYSSRNASLQKIVNELLPKGEKIAQDGDLLSHSDFNPMSALATSGTEDAMRRVIRKYGMPLDDAQLKQDLLKEKELAFENTLTYETFRKTYKALKGKNAPYAIVPSIELHSEKVSRILTTEHFAGNVNKRYQRCMSVKKR